MLAGDAKRGDDAELTPDYAQRQRLNSALRLAGRPEDRANSPIPPEEGPRPALLMTVLDREEVLVTPPPYWDHDAQSRPARRRR